MKNKNGFTLVELLAVIVVLAIISLIAVPTITGVIDRAKKGALKDSAYRLVDAATLYYAQYGEIARFDFDSDGDAVSSTNNKLGYKGKVENGSLIVNNKGKIMLCINDGKNAAYKNYSDTSVVVVTGKTCNVNESETQVLLDGENTISEYTNQELTELIDSLQARVNELETLKTDIDRIDSELTTVTHIAPQLSSNVTGGIGAYIKNGWCMVTMELTPNANAFTATITSIATGLPKPATPIFFSLGTSYGNSYTARLDINGNLEFYYTNYKTAERIDATIAYPVA